MRPCLRGDVSMGDSQQRDMSVEQVERPGRLDESMGLQRPFWLAASLSDLGLTAEQVDRIPELKRLVDEYAKPCSESDWWLAGGELLFCPKHKRRFSLGRCPGHVDRRAAPDAPGVVIRVHLRAARG